MCVCTEDRVCVFEDHFSCSLPGWENGRWENVHPLWAGAAKDGNGVWHASTVIE